MCYQAVGLIDHRAERIADHREYNLCDRYENKIRDDHDIVQMVRRFGFGIRIREKGELVDNETGSGITMLRKDMII